MTIGRKAADRFELSIIAQVPVFGKINTFTMFSATRAHALCTSV
jgi:hypothetical protein